MRKIIYRAKRKDNGKWVEGYYIHLHKTTHCVIGVDFKKDDDNDIHQIVYEQMTDWNLPNQYFRVDIDPETLGQYIGTHDANNARIFEGDIVEHDFGNYGIGKQRAVVCYNEHYAGFNLNPINDWAYVEIQDCVIVGNIYDLRSEGDGKWKSTYTTKKKS